MNNRFISLLTLIAVLNLTACATYVPKYQRIGKFGAVPEQRSHIQPKDVEIYVQQYPEGFERSGDLTSISEGYQGYEILGEVSVQYEPPSTGGMFAVGLLTFGIGPIFMFNPGELTQERAVNIMQKRAAEMGGNAVIGARIPQESATSSNSFLANFNYASGIVVYIPENKVANAD